jgi:hypothetical protein
MNIRLSQRRAIVLGITLLLLAVILSGVSRMMRETNSTKGDASPLPEREASANEADKAMLGSPERSPRDDWRRTVESAAAGLTANDDAPVRIGFVQTSPDQRQWRVSLQRTPAAGEVLDAAKITIQVETLATADQAQSDGRENLAIDWETQGRSFEEAAAPRLKVTAGKPVSHLRFRVFYDGTEIERRTYSARNGD